MITEFNEYNKSPFMVTLGNRLYINEEIMKYLVFTPIPNHNIWDQRVCDFKFNDNMRDVIKNSNKNILMFFEELFIRNTQNTCFILTYNNSYAMSILIRKNERNGFRYYIEGNSGDFSMHGKNMIRATKEINLKIIQIFFPEIENNKEYKMWLKGEKKFNELVNNWTTYNKIINIGEENYQKYLNRVAEYEKLMNVKKFNL